MASRKKWNSSMFTDKVCSCLILFVSFILIFIVSKRNIVFTFWGEILVTIVGEEEYDELTLSDTLDILGEYVKEVTKRQLNELNEQHIDYEKLCIGFDEMISSTVCY